MYRRAVPEQNENVEPMQREGRVLRTRFTDLVGCSVPLQQAPIGGASPRLTAAVAEAGGLGMVGAILYPPPVLAAILDAVRAQTGGVFGVNILMPFLDRACVEVAVARARVVEFFYGDPDASLVDLVHAGGALAGWQVGSQDEARRAADVGCDFVVAQGVEAGGHVRGSLALLPLLSEVLEVVDVPVVAAGGIGTGRAMAAALAAGAEAVRVGTRFIAAAEAEYHPTYVDAVIAARGEDAMLTEAFSTMWPDAPHRVGFVHRGSRGVPGRRRRRDADGGGAHADPPLRSAGADARDDRHGGGDGPLRRSVGGRSEGAPARRGDRARSRRLSRATATAMGQIGITRRVTDTAA